MKFLILWCVLLLTTSAAFAQKIVIQNKTNNSFEIVVQSDDSIIHHHTMRRGQNLTVSVKNTKIVTIRYRRRTSLCDNNNKEVNFVMNKYSKMSLKSTKDWDEITISNIDRNFPRYWYQTLYLAFPFLICKCA